MLQKLNLECDRSDRNGLLGTELLSLLCKEQGCGEQASSEEWYPTIGSRIQSLSLGPCNDGYSGFFKLLAQNRHRMDLTALTVTGFMTEEDVTSLAECMLMFGPLRKLIVNRSFVNVFPLLHSLRENGNITSMRIRYLFWNKICAKFTKLYTKRNRCLHKLLLQATCRKSELCQQEQPKESRAGLFLVPTLLEVAKQVPNRRASTLTTCLLRLLDNCDI
jgi:hypothetical protein